MKKNHRLFKVDKCRLCFSTKLIPVVSLGKQYLSDFTKSKRKPESYPLNLIMCPKCYLVQLSHTVPQSSLYTERYGYKSGINNTMRNELKEIVKKAMAKIDKSIKAPSVMDIGANDGTLLSMYPEKFFRIGVEPIKKFSKECKMFANIVVNDFFNYEKVVEKVGKKKINVITAISCFYDIDDPNNFVEGVKKLLDEDGVFIIQQNYLINMLENYAFDNIVHEHLEYYSLLSLESLLAKHDLEVFEVELSEINGGSFRTYIRHKKNVPIHPSVKIIREKEGKIKIKETRIFKNFEAKIYDHKKKINKLINDMVSKKKKVYLYGASTRGNTLLQYYKLDNSLITAAVERNSEKWGKVIASVGIPIISEEQARIEKPDYMLVLPWFFKEEFLKREKKYLKEGGHFIFPLPEIEVI